MKNILTIIRKEFARFFKDKRMVLTTLFLPGILIYVMYSFMGTVIEDMVTVDEDYRYTAYMINCPQSLGEAFGSLFELKEVPAGAETDDLKEEVASAETDLVAVFPENFEALIIAYDSSSGQPAPNVEIYFNSVETNSYSAYNVLTTVLDQYESSIANKFDVNAGDKVYDLGESENAMSQVVSMIMPMLMLMMLFSGCMAVAPESIAGEKDRGTIATLLVTPIKRSQLAIGKIISLSCIAMLSGLSSFLGIILSLPKLMGGVMGDNAAILYGFADYLMIFGIVISTVLILISLISILSALAKSVKEASVMVTPLMLVVMVVGLMSMFSNGSPAFWQYLIPVYNSATALNAVMSFTVSPVNVLLCIFSNLVYAGALVVVLTLMFKSEKIMFKK